MLADFVHTNTFLHRLDVRTKLVWFVSIILAVFLFEHPLVVLSLLMLQVLVLTISGLPTKGAKRIGVMLFPVLLILLLVTMFTHTPERFGSSFSQTVLFYLFPNQTAPLTVGGVLLGLTIVCRICSMVLASLLLTYTTPIDDFLQVAQRLRVPYVIAFIITTALRFIPTMEQKAMMVLDAQRARGADLDSGGLIKRVRSFGSVLIPMIVDSIRMSENLALALINRGFGASRRMTFYDEIQMKACDYRALALNVAFLGVVLFTYFTHAGQL
jgi:energy-coupling factor transport system permease protein